MDWDKVLKLLKAKTERQCPEMADYANRGQNYKGRRRR